MATTTSLTKQLPTRTDEKPKKPAPVTAQNQVTTVVLGGRTYIFRHAELMPPHDPDEKQSLREDIAARGVQTPVLVTEDGVVVDGHTRLLIAAELGHTDIPVEVMVGLSDEEARQRAVALNVHRRHLSQEQKRVLIARNLMADPNRSNGVIAADLKVDRKTVETVRREMEATGEVPMLSETQGKDGKSRPRRIEKKKTAGKTAPSPASPDREAVSPDSPDSDADTGPQVEAADFKAGTSGTQVDEAAAKRRTKDQLWKIGDALETLGVEIQDVSEERESTWTRAQLVGFMKRLREEAIDLKALIES
ncbi:MAG TPA: ParB N-terminal domain-containing protein [Gemmataceae bacterium]|nr:ParB N-terminal domain-containing protein [Gemmataceae bacterium]